MVKILLASQYKVSIQKITNLLMHWDFDILTTTSGAEALRLHKERIFDLIVSDFELAEMSGSTLCTLIRQEEISPHVPFIITCHNIPRRIERSNRSGASAVVLKPLDPIKLLNVIGDHLGLHLIRGKRHSLEIMITVDNRGQEFTCFSYDISNTGMLIKSGHPLKIGSHITCRFTLPDYCQMEIEGEVVRYMAVLDSDNLYGIKFTAMEATHGKAIDSYIQSIQNKSFSPHKKYLKVSAMMGLSN